MFVWLSIEELRVAKFFLLRYFGSRPVDVLSMQVTRIRLHNSDLPEFSLSTQHSVTRLLSGKDA